MNRVDREVAQAWKAAAIADGWTCEPIYTGGESVDSAARLKRGEFVAQVYIREFRGNPDCAVYVWGRDGLEGITTPIPYSWAAINERFCGHDYEHIATVGNCLNRYRCRKCNAVHDIDSSG